MASTESDKLLRYPLYIEDEETPFVMFNFHRATYKRASEQNNKINKDLESHVAMYVPAGFAINDSMTYENVATGVVGAAAETFGADLSVDSVLGFINTNKDALIQQYGTEAATAAGGAAGASVGGFASTVLGGAGVGVVASGLLNERQKGIQKTINPREFALFKSPNLRSFTMEFKMIPTSKGESESCEKIIKKFRSAMYPEVTGSGGLTYTFPKAVTIQFSDNIRMIRLPECVIESATVTFNPNSISYFKDGGRPVEIDMSLTFKELMPLSRAAIEGGF